MFDAFASLVNGEEEERLSTQQYRAPTSSTSSTRSHSPPKARLGTDSKGSKGKSHSHSPSPASSRPKSGRSHKHTHHQKSFDKEDQKERKSDVGVELQEQASSESKTNHVERRVEYSPPNNSSSVSFNPSTLSSTTSTTRSPPSALSTSSVRDQSPPSATSTNSARDRSPAKDRSCLQPPKATFSFSAAKVLGKVQHTLSDVSEGIDEQQEEDANMDKSESVVVFGEVIQQAYEQDQVGKMFFFLFSFLVGICAICIFSVGVSPDWLNTLQEVQNEVFWDLDLGEVAGYDTVVDFIENQLDFIFDISNSDKPSEGIFFNVDTQLIEVLFIMECDAEKSGQDDCQYQMEDVYGLGPLRVKDKLYHKQTYLLYSAYQTPNATADSRELASMVANVFATLPDSFSDPGFHYSVWNEEYNLGATLKLEFNFIREYNDPFRSRTSRVPNVNTEYLNIRDQNGIRWRDVTAMFLCAVLCLFTLIFALGETRRYTMCHLWQEQVEGFDKKRSTMRSLRSTEVYNWWNLTNMFHILYTLLGVGVIFFILLSISMDQTQNYNISKFGTQDTLEAAVGEHRTVRPTALDRTASYILVGYVISCMLQVLRSFRFHPGVSILTRTMFLARHDLVDVISVLLIVIVAFWILTYGIAGLASLHDDFVLPARAFSSLALLAFGFYEFEDWMNEGRGRQFDGVGVNDNASVKEFIFWILVFLIMIIVPNILLAVIIGAYERAVSEDTDAGMVYKQRTNIFKVVSRQLVPCIMDFPYLFISRPSCLHLIPLLTDDEGEPVVLSKWKRLYMRARFCSSREAYMMVDHFLFPWTNKLLRPDACNDELVPSPGVLRNTELFTQEPLAEVVKSFEHSWLIRDGYLDSDTAGDIAFIIFTLWGCSQSEAEEEIGLSGNVETRHRHALMKTVHKVDHRTRKNEDRLDYLDSKINLLLERWEIQVPRHHSRPKSMAAKPKMSDAEKQEQRRIRKRRKQQHVNMVKQNQEALNGGGNRQNDRRPNLRRASTVDSCKVQQVIIHTR